MTIRRLALAAGFAAAIGGGTAASAQTPPQDIPRAVSELRVESDHNGVNLVSGRTQNELPVLSVPAAPNLRFDRIQNAAPYVVGRVNGQAGEIPVGNWTMHTPGATESFACSDWVDCDSVTGTGSYFRGPAGPNGAGGTYKQAGTGATWHFAYASAVGPGPVRQSYASNVHYPSGENIVYSYDTQNNGGQTIYRPNRIESNLGYFITIAYSTADLGSVYWGSPAQATLYSIAAPNTPLGRLTYAYSGGDMTATDLAGRTYSCTGCRNALGTDIAVWSGSSQLPGDSAPNRQVAALPTLPLVGSVTQNGVPYSYSYTRDGGAPYLHLPSNSYWYTRLSVTGPSGFSQVYTFTQSGQRNVLTSSVDSLGRTTSYSFDTAYRPTQITYPELNKVSVVYDEFGNVTARTATPRQGSGLSPIIETAGYPGPSCIGSGSPQVLCWRPIWSRDALGRQTDYLYNNAGQMIEQTEPADAAGVRRRTIVDYTPSPLMGISRATAVRLCGVGTTCGTNQEHRTEYQYLGDTGLVTRERRIDPATGATIDTNYSYDLAGRLVATDGPLPGTGDTSYNRYDSVGQLTGTISPDPDGAGIGNPRLAVRNSYDQAGRLIRVETGTLLTWQSEQVAPADWTGFTVLSSAETQYAHNRKIREFVREGGSGPVRAMTEHSYDVRGRLECTAIRMNPAVYAFTGTPNACVPGTPGTPPNDYGPDRIARTVYDLAGQRIQLREGVGSAVEAAEATWAYNLNGQVTTVIDGNGNRAELRYDGHMRQDRWTFPSATRPPAYNDATQASALTSAGAVNPNDYEAYGYDPAGNRTSLRKRDGSTLTYQYDNLNRMIAKIVPERAGLPATHTRDVHYGYDLRNLQLYARFDGPTGEGITNAYDAFGRLTSSTLLMDGTARALGYAWDASGNRTRLVHPDGQAFATLYDGLNRPVWMGTEGVNGIASVVYLAHGAPLALNRLGASLAFDYDAVQRPVVRGFLFPAAASNVTWVHGYNPAGGISRETRDNDAYAWTGAYNATRPYATNGLNQYSATGQPNTAGSVKFTYDANGNLATEAIWNGSTYIVSTTYTYDIENRLVAASGSRTAALRYDPLGRLYEVTSPSGTTRFLYDGDALVAEYDAAGTMLRRHAHWPGADVPMTTYEGSGFGTVRQLFPDRQGSIAAIADENGVRLAVNSYDEYGIPRTGNVGRFQYTGQAWLAELGMYHYKARIYSPTLGRFLQTDPVGYEDQYNLYAYVGNDPINQVDPSGMCATGSRLGESIQCRTHFDYSMPRAAQGTGSARQYRLSSTTRAVLNDRVVALQIWNAWGRSGGDGPAREKNEYGFWVTPISRNRFRVGELIAGSGPNIRYDRILAARPAGASIFVHVHPFRSSGEHPYVRSISISPGDMRVASELRALVISVARREPYTGRGFYVDETDYRR